MYQLLYHPRVERQLKKLTLKEREKVIAKIDQLTQDPFAQLDIKKLANTTSSYRLRIGEIRVLYELDQDTQTLTIVEVGYRGQVY